MDDIDYVRETRDAAFEELDELKAKLLAVAQQAERFRILGDEYAKEGDPVKAAMYHAVAVCLEKAIA